MNRADAAEATLAADAPATAIISITDVGQPPNSFCPQSWLKDILRLQFNDVEAFSALAITGEDARRICEFALAIKGRVSRLIVHCEYGVSRSAAVAAAIMKAFTGDDSPVWDSPCYEPNLTCYSLVQKAFVQYEEALGGWD